MTMGKAGKAVGFTAFSIAISKNMMAGAKRLKKNSAALGKRARKAGVKVGSTKKRRKR